MRGWEIRLTTWLAAMGVCGLSLAQEVAPNQVRNPSLEEAPGAQGIPSGWLPYSYPEGRYRSSIVEGGFVGNKALLIEGDGDYGGVVTNGISVQPGKRYYLRGRVRVEGDPKTQAFIRFGAWDENNKNLGGLYPAPAAKPATQDWQLVSVVDPLRDVPQARYLRAALNVHGNGKAWFDDVELVERSDAPAGNLLQDGSMESIHDQRVLTWRPTVSAGGQVKLEPAHDPVRHGWYSLRMHGSAESAVAASRKVPVEKGKRYTLSGWSRAPRGRAEIRLAYFEGDKQLGRTASQPISGPEWAQRTVEAELDRYPTTTHVTAVCAALGGEIDTGFDDFVLSAR